MTSYSAQQSRSEFSESVRLSMWGIGLLGLVLGVTAGVLTGISIRNLVGDEPIISGSGAAVFYVTFAFAILLDLFLLLNFTNLAVRVTDRGFRFRYGMFAKNLTWDQLKSAEPADYSWMAYGGWGIRFSTGGRRAWSQLGVKRGVVVHVDEGGKQRSYFVSSRRPEELVAALARHIAPAEPVNAEPTGQPGPSSAP